MTKPTGRYQCLACRQEWDGNQLYFDPTLGIWTCGNLACGAGVQKVDTAASDTAVEETD